MSEVGGVVTTGIYCLPDCVARPSPRNVRMLPSAAAAEAAGFRSCHRCRPYRESPALPLSAPAIVCAAVDLISSGAADTHDEATLARYVGVSGRHLRRLFVEHVGVTPDQLARSRRAHFARRLLDDTALHVTDIAHAAGFGSIRQFNRVMHAVFHASPTDLRRRRRVADRLLADGGLAIRLPTSEGYVFDNVLDLLRAAAIDRVESVSASHYRRIITVDGDPTLIEISCLDERRTLRLVAHLPRLNGLIHLVHRIRRMIHLEPTDQPLGAWSTTEAKVRSAIRTPLDRQLVVQYVAEHGRHVPGLGAHRLDRAFPVTVDSIWMIRRLARRESHAT